MLRDYFPPEMVIGILRGLKTAAVQSIMILFSTYGLTHSWGVSISAGGVAFAVALGARTAEGAADSRPTIKRDALREAKKDAAIVTAIEEKIDPTSVPPNN